MRLLRDARKDVTSFRGGLVIAISNILNMVSMATYAHP